MIRRLLISASILALATLFACSKGPSLPPLAGGEADAALPGKFVWHNLVTSDAEEARAFYGGLFGWEFDVIADGRYSVISFDGENIGGIIDASKDAAPLRAARWLSAVSVPEVGPALLALEAAGGRQLEEPIDVPGIGRVVTVRDEGGAVFHLLGPIAGDPPDGEPSVNTWLWHELLTADPDRAAAFYAEVFEYELESIPRPSGSVYRVLSRSGRPRAGVIKNPFGSSDSAWVPYVRVEDPSALTKRAEALGGYVAVAPAPDIRNGTLALVLDPGGAPVALQQWSRDLKVEP